MNKTNLILYLNLMLEIAPDRSFMILLDQDEISEMKKWCRDVHRHYNYSYTSSDKLSYYYEILPA